ncbi:MAG TPA: alpha-galactosidase [Planctomycetes bacterium]|nr:alpha-galactosidase [Planctomycetota bacterium]
MLHFVLPFAFVLSAQGAPTLSELASDTVPADCVLLEDLALESIEQEWDRAKAARSVDENPLRIGGTVFLHGVGSHARAEAVLRLDGGALRFQAAVGVDDEVGTAGSVIFQVLGDDRELARTPIMRGGDTPQVLDVDVRGVKELVLLIKNGGDGINYDHADWGGARLVIDPSSKNPPAIVRVSEDPTPPIVRLVPDAPRIHAPFVVGSTPGRPFLFRIPTSGVRPMLFTAKGLPEGVELDGENGILRGAIAASGSYEVELVVESPYGRDTSTLTIRAGDHLLAQTPPMGWNSWNVWGLAVDDAKVRDAADWLVRTGLADFGFNTINIDDAWEGERDENGVLQPNEKFPDMRALADYVHSKGLHLGIYSSPGTLTCGGYAGSFGHEAIDAATWAEWGIDYVKYDWCSYRNEARDQSLPEFLWPYLVMRRALDEVPRDIVYSLCQYGMGEVARWGANVGGNLWRTTGDITDSWSSMARIGFDQDQWSPYAGPGHWNDPDMLVVGKVGWGPSLHPTRLTPNEQITHISLWSLLAAPLLIGCDLTEMDDFTLALLRNDEVLAIDQDPLGEAARRVHEEGDVEVWARPLADGAWAVGLFNRGRRATTVRFDPATIGRKEHMELRDLWLHRDLGGFEGHFETIVPRHGVVLLRVNFAERLGR